MLGSMSNILMWASLVNLVLLYGSAGYSILSPRSLAISRNCVLAICQPWFLPTFIQRNVSYMYIHEATIPHKAVLTRFKKKAGVCDVSGLHGPFNEIVTPLQRLKN